MISNFIGARDPFATLKNNFKKEEEKNRLLNSIKYPKNYYKSNIPERGEDNVKDKLYYTVVDVLNNIMGSTPGDTLTFLNFQDLKYAYDDINRIINTNKPDMTLKKLENIDVSELKKAANKFFTKKNIKASIKKKLEKKTENFLKNKISLKYNVSQFNTPLIKLVKSSKINLIQILKEKKNTDFYIDILEKKNLHLFDLEKSHFLCYFSSSKQLESNIDNLNTNYNVFDQFFKLILLLKEFNNFQLTVIYYSKITEYTFQNILIDINKSEKKILFLKDYPILFIRNNNKTYTIDLFDEKKEGNQLLNFFNEKKKIYNAKYDNKKPKEMTYTDFINFNYNKNAIYFTLYLFDKLIEILGIDKEKFLSFLLPEKINLFNINFDDEKNILVDYFEKDKTINNVEWNFGYEKKKINLDLPNTSFKIYHLFTKLRTVILDLDNKFVHVITENGIFLNYEEKINNICTLYEEETCEDNLSSAMIEEALFKKRNMYNLAKDIDLTTGNIMYSIEKYLTDNVINHFLYIMFMVKENVGFLNKIFSQIKGKFLKFEDIFEKEKMDLFKSIAFHYLIDSQNDDHELIKDPDIF